MIALLPSVGQCCAFLATYFLHSTLFIAAVLLAAMIAGRRLHAELRVMAWKLALIVPLLTTVLTVPLGLPHLGTEFVLEKTT
ncbi:MAG: hypothetical protein MI861_20380, partial [Pirellulales bacterium]|nr:hypothetical protein [Pirellulales bacterium]